MKSLPELQKVRVGLMLAAALVGVAIVAVGYYIVQPLVAGAKAAEPEAKLKLPEYDLTAWRTLPVQMDGRVMPFETAAINALRQITGRSKFEKQDAVAVVLSWMLTQGGTAGLPSGFINWEEYPFIHCDDPRLREPILKEFLKAESLPDDVLNGKYLSPKQIRNSKELRKLQLAAREKLKQDPDKGNQTFTPEERKAQEVGAQLSVYDSLTQGNPVTNALRHMKPDDPLHLVALDKVKDSAWFTIGDLAACLGDPAAWQALIAKRMQATPHLYLAPERQQALKQFQELIRQGKENQALDELDKKLKADRRQRAAKFRELANESLPKAQKYLKEQAVRTVDDDARLGKFLQNAKPDQNSSVPPLDQLANSVESILKVGDDEKLEMLAQEAARARKTGYLPEKDEFRSLHMIYLELLYPKLYEEAVAWQPFPEPKARKVLADHADLRQAYLGQNPESFGEATQRFFGTIAAVSKETEPTYPNCDTLALEMKFNRAEPFKWAWVTMALAALCFAASLGIPGRAVYLLGFAFFLTSLAFQVYGFYCRIAISGRPPVTNMYETVIFVASMVAVFALALELIYRPRTIALAGSVVATLGLVLADQLPVSSGFDSAIKPLVPVLRSNFWLIIHVMTIVASYAAGALAWGMGNLVLIRYSFRTPSPTELKDLSKLTYRSMQIAVLLLAAGTFLGGWWAAYSWGRFWGWDPKETWALIALIVYVIPLHARYVGWVKDFGLAVSAVVCFSAIVMSWYGVNFILGAGLHSYGFGGGGPWYVYLACLLNLQFVLFVCMKNVNRRMAALEEADLARQLGVAAPV